MYQIPKMKLLQTGSPVVTTDAMKTFLRVDGSDEDALIANQVKAATLRLERECDQKFMSQTWAIYFDGFPCGVKAKDQWWDGTRDGAISQLLGSGGKIELPFGPVLSVTHIKTYDNSDVAYTMSATDYQVDLVSAVPSIGLRLGSIWPTTVLRPMNGIEIEAVFGYENMPEDIIEAVKQMTAAMYEHRGDEIPLLPKSVNMLIEPYRKLKI